MDCIVTGIYLWYDRRSFWRW